MDLRKTWRIVGAVLLLALSVGHLLHGLQVARTHGLVDLPIFLDTVAAFIDGGSLYPFADDLASYAPAAAVYKFPPLFAMLLIPFCSPEIRDIVYPLARGLQIVLYALAVGLAVLLLGGGSRRRLVFWATVLALNFEPFYETLWRFQLETPILLLLFVCLLGLIRRHEGLAGSALAVAAMLKLYPGFLALYLVLRRRWRALAWLVVTTLAILIAGIVVFGIGENRVYFLRILPAMLGEAPVVSAENASLGRVFVLLGAGPTLSATLLRMVTLSGLGVTVWLVHRRRTASPGDMALELSLLVSLLLTTMPNSWVNYQLLLLLPLLALLARALEGGRPFCGADLTALAAYLLMLFYAPCAEPSVGWPCAQTPAFLGLVPLPRALHDGAVNARFLAPILIWVACLLRLRTPGAAA